MREGLKQILKPIVGRVEINEDEEELMNSLSNEKADFIIADPLSFSSNGFKFFLALNYEFPEVKIIFYLGFLSKFVLVALRDVEFAGVLMKSQEIDEVRKILTGIFDGEQYIQPQVMIDLLQGKHDSVGSIIQSLTSKEKEVLKLVKEGYSNEEVGQLLKISKRTVNCHKNNIMGKTRMKNTAALIQFVNDFEYLIYDKN